MKRFPVFFGCLFFAFTAIAQPVTFSPDTVLYGQAIPNEYHDFQIDMIYGQPDTLSLSWRLVGNTLPNGWVYELCDFGQCYTDPPNTGTMAPISGDDFGYLKVILNPYQIAGSGSLSYWVFPTGDMDDHTTVHFFLSTDDVTGLSNLQTATVKTYPNPASHQLIVETHGVAFDRYRILSAQGVLIQEGPFNPSSPAIHIAHLSAGHYYLQLANAEHQAQTIILKK